MSIYDHGSINYLSSLFNEPFQFYSCFISYASKDHAFAERLYADLQNHGVRCWFAPEDMKIGDRLRPRIDETIRLYDKLLLVLSRTSVASQWVEEEVEIALARERQHKTTILFPVRIDNTVMTLETGWPALICNTRNIGDFRRWKTHDVYQQAFDRLLRDLKATERQTGR
jgi:TIR domain